jgi:hypothetical protein
MIRLRFPSVIATAVLTTTVLGCSGDDGPPKACLLPRQQMVTAMAPAKVSVFFTVDTCEGEPVTDLQNADIVVREDGARLSALETQQRLLKSPSSFRAYTAIVLDITGSIIRGDSLGSVQAAATDLARSLTQAGAEHYVGVFTFDGRPKLTMVQAFTNTTQTLEQAIAGISAQQCSGSNPCTMADHMDCVEGSGTGLCIDSSTNLYGAFVEGLTTLDMTLAAATGVPYKIGSLLVFTDGMDDAARVQRNTAVDRTRNTDHFVYDVGLSSSADATFLSTATNNNSQIVNGPGDLGAAFNAVGDKIKQQTGRFYLLEYCSPKRSGRHEVSVTATSNEGAEGAFTATFDATGFTSGCTI